MARPALVPAGPLLVRPAGAALIQSGPAGAALISRTPRATEVPEMPALAQPGRDLR